MHTFLALSQMRSLAAPRYREGDEARVWWFTAPPTWSQSLKIAAIKVAN